MTDMAPLNLIHNLNHYRLKLSIDKFQLVHYSYTRLTLFCATPNDLEICYLRLPWSIPLKPSIERIEYRRNISFRVNS